MVCGELYRKRSSWSRLRSALAPDERWRLGAMFLVIAAFHLVGWCTLVLIVNPAHFSVGDKAFGMGIGLTAYTLGLRHAFDADHIAAIDNTTRKLMNDGQRPLAVGFFFSLGHSSVVFGLAVLLAIGLKAIVGPVQRGSSALHHYTDIIGTTVSGVFLWHVPLGHDRRLVYELRIWLGVFQPGAQGLLQHHDHRAFGSGRTAHRDRRTVGTAGRSIRLERSVLGLARRCQSQRHRLHHRWLIRRDMGYRSADLALRSHRAEVGDGGGSRQCRAGELTCR